MTGADKYLQIAGLHKRSLPYGFLSSLKTETLAAIYRALDRSRGCVVIIKYDKNGLAGFVSGSITRKAQIRALLSHAFSIGSKLIMDPALYKKLGTMFAVARHLGVASDLKQGLPAAELISIAVSLECRGQGIGKVLYNELACWFERRGASRFYIRVGGNLQNAQHFYGRLGAILVPNVKVGINDGTLIFMHGVSHSN